MRAGTGRLWAAGAVAAASLALVAWIASGGEGVPPAAAVAQAPAPAPAVPDGAPPSAPAGPSAPAVAAAPPAAPSAAEDDHMERLRVEAEERPMMGLQLAEEGERRFPGGRHAAERAYLKMRAFVHLGDIVPAREEARQFFEKHGRAHPLGQYVWRLTGMRPRPSPWEGR